MLYFIASRFFFIAGLTLPLFGCSRGVAEFHAYSQAFDAQYAEGALILDAAAKAERIVGLRRLQRGSDGIVIVFNPDYAAYYVEGVDPPIVGTIRASTKALKAYNDALAGLADGEAAAALTSKLGQVTSNLIGAGVSAYAAIGSPAASVVGAEQWAKRAADEIQVALPIFQKVASWAAQEAFRKQLIEGYPEMRKLLITLRAGTPRLFALLERSMSERLNTPSGLSTTGLATLEKSRTQLAGWVLLLDRTLEAMDAAAAAALNDMPPLDLAHIAEASSELKILAEKVKLQRNR